MLRAFVMLAALCSCAQPAKTKFTLSVTNLATGPVMGASGEYDAAFSPGWVRASTNNPIFVPGEFADERLTALGTAGDALTYFGTEGAAFPENLAATYSDAQLHAGGRFETEFEASAGQLVTVACMFGPSNDTIAAAPGFSLFEGEIPRSGDVSGQFSFYDLGVEQNEEPGFGANQPAHGTGGVAEHQPIARIIGVDARGNAYPELSTLLRVELSVLKNL